MKIPVCEKCGIEAELDQKHNVWVCPKCGDYSPCKPGSLSPAALPLRNALDNRVYDFVSKTVFRLAERKSNMSGVPIDETKETARVWLAAAAGANPCAPIRQWPSDVLSRAADAVAPYSPDPPPQRDIF